MSRSPTETDRLKFGAMKAIPLGHTGKSAIIDEEDFERVSAFKWCMISTGYGNNKTAGLMHRFILSAPKGMVVDHINGDKIDNRKANLRICTQSENVLNKRPGRLPASGAVGVDWHPETKKWRPRINKNGKAQYFGLYETKEEAIAARLDAERRLFGEFRWGAKS
jgi:hypothetical protein